MTRALLAFRYHAHVRRRRSFSLADALAWGTERRVLADARCGGLLLGGDGDLRFAPELQEYREPPTRHIGKGKQKHRRKKLWMNWPAEPPILGLFDVLFYDFH